MAKELHFPSMPLAEEFDVGDDSDLPGFDQPYTLDDIGAILNSADASVEERREVLRRMADDLQARQGMDEASEFGDLLDEVRGALASLSETGDGATGGFTSDPADLALAPDEILERAEEEAARERDEG